MTTREMSKCLTTLLVMLTVCAQLVTPAWAAERTSQINDPKIYVDPGISVRSAQRQQAADQSVLRGMQVQAAALGGLTYAVAGSSNTNKNRVDRVEMPLPRSQPPAQTTPPVIIVPPGGHSNRNRVDRAESPLPRPQPPIQTTPPITPPVTPPFRPPTTGRPSVRVGGGTR